MTKIQNLKIAELKPYPENPRDNDAAVPGVVASIRQYGFIGAIIVNKDKVIINGHTRVKAMKELGADTIPAIVVDHLTPEQERALKHWNRNGSSITIENMLKLKEKDPEEMNRLLDYIRSAPVYVETAVPMKRFVLVHGGLKDFSPEKGLDEYDAFDLMWTRPVLEDRYWDDRLVIIGHTPTHEYGVGADDQMLVTKTWVDIDTGAADGGSPMLLRLDDMHPFYAES